MVITGRDQATVEQTAREISTDDNEVVPCVCDVNRRDDILRTVDMMLSRFEHIDTLLNVAGVNRRMLAVELTEDDYDFIVNTNLRGAFVLSQIVGKHMLERKRGSQINITSLNNDRPLKGVLPYAVSKAGLEQMTRSMALEWGPGGIRVNAIAPGFILTDLTHKLWSQPKMREWGLTNTPLKRMGEVQDLVGAALFLASEASAFMTGQTLFVDGGFSAGLAWPIEFDK